MTLISRFRQIKQDAYSTIGIDSVGVLELIPSGTTYLTTLDSLPISNINEGDKVFIEENQRLYISPNSTGWYNVAYVNLTPQFDSDINSSFTVVDSQTPLVISNPATDSDTPIIYGGTASDSAQYLVDITRDSSVWTFTPKSSDSAFAAVTAGNLADSANKSFTYTMTATDNINTASKTILVNYNHIVYSYDALIPGNLSPINFSRQTTFGANYLMNIDTPPGNDGIRITGNNTSDGNMAGWHNVWCGTSTNAGKVSTIFSDYMNASNKTIRSFSMHKANNVLLGWVEFGGNWWDNPSDAQVSVSTASGNYGWTAQLNGPGNQFYYDLSSRGYGTTGAYDDVTDIRLWDTTIKDKITMLEDSQRNYTVGEEGLVKIGFFTS